MTTDKFSCEPDLDLSSDSIPSVLSERHSQTTLPYKSDPKIFQKLRTSNDSERAIKENFEIVRKLANPNFKNPLIETHGHNQTNQGEFVFEISDQNQFLQPNTRFPYRSISKKTVKGIKSSTPVNDENEPAILPNGYLLSTESQPGQQSSYQNMIINSSNQTTIKPPHLALNSLLDMTKGFRKQNLNPQVNKPSRLDSPNDTFNSNSSDRALRQMDTNVILQTNFDPRVHLGPPVRVNMKKGPSISFEPTCESNFIIQNQSMDGPESGADNETGNKCSSPKMTYQRHEGQAREEILESINVRDEDRTSYIKPPTLHSLTNTSIVEFTPSKFNENGTFLDNFSANRFTDRMSNQKEYECFDIRQSFTDGSIVCPSVLSEQKESILSAYFNKREPFGSEDGFARSNKKSEPFDQVIKNFYNTNQTYLPNKSDQINTDSVSNKKQNPSSVLERNVPIIPINEVRYDNPMNLSRLEKDSSNTPRGSNIEVTRYYSPGSKVSQSQIFVEEEEAEQAQPNFEPEGSPKSDTTSFASCLSEPQVVDLEDEEEKDKHEELDKLEESPQERGSLSLFDSKEMGVYLPKFENNFGLSRITEEDSWTQTTNKDRDHSPRKELDSPNITLEAARNEDILGNHPYLTYLSEGSHVQEIEAFRNNLEDHDLLQRQIESRLELTGTGHQKLTQKENVIINFNDNLRLQRIELAHKIREEENASSNTQPREQENFSPFNAAKTSSRGMNSQPSFCYLDSSAITRNFEPVAVEERLDEQILSNLHEITPRVLENSQAEILAKVNRDEDKSHGTLAEETLDKGLEACNSEKIETITEEQFSLTPAGKIPTKRLATIPNRLMPDTWPGYPEDNYVAIKFSTLPPIPLHMHQIKEELEEESHMTEKEEEKEEIEHRQKNSEIQEFPSEKSIVQEEDQYHSLNQADKSISLEEQQTISPKKDEVIYELPSELAVKEDKGPEEKTSPLNRVDKGSTFKMEITPPPNKYTVLHIPLHINDLLPCDPAPEILHTQQAMNTNRLPVIEEINSTQVQETPIQEREDFFEPKQNLSNISINMDFCITEPAPFMSRVLSDSEYGMNNKSLNGINSLGQSLKFDMLQPVQVAPLEQSSIKESSTYSNYFGSDKLDEIQKMRSELVMLSCNFSKIASSSSMVKDDSSVKERVNTKIYENLYEDHKRRDAVKKKKELTKKADEAKQLEAFKKQNVSKGNLTKKEEDKLINRLYAVKKNKSAQNTHRSNNYSQELHYVGMDYKPERNIATPKTDLSLKSVKSPVRSSNILKTPSNSKLEKNKNVVYEVHEIKNSISNKENQMNHKNVSHNNRNIVKQKKPTVEKKKASEPPSRRDTQRSRISYSNQDTFELLFDPDTLKTQTLCYDGFLNNYNSQVKNKLDVFAKPKPHNPTTSKMPTHFK